MTTRPKTGTVPYTTLEGETARPWAEIEELYLRLDEGNAVFGPLAALAGTLARSPFAHAGLSGTTSMHDLCIGPSTHVLQNPHLRISFDFDGRVFSIAYVDGSADPWTTQAPVEHVLEVITRVLTKRARWFTDR